VEDLTINSAEESIAQDYLSHILYISIISKTDLLLQAIIQGFSTALSGTPLGMEVDVRKFPPNSYNVRFASTPYILSTPVQSYRTPRPRTNTPVVLSSQQKVPFWPSDDEEENDMEEEQEEEEGENISNTNDVEATQDKKSSGHLELQGEERGGDIKDPPSDGFTDSEMSSHGTTATQGSPENQPTHQPTHLLDLSHYSQHALVRAKKKARVSYETFASEHGMPPDYGIAIEMAFSTVNDADSCKMKAYHERQQNRRQRYKDDDRRSNLNTYSITWHNHYSSIEEGEEEGSVIDSAGEGYAVGNDDILDDAIFDLEVTNITLTIIIYLRRTRFLCDTVIHATT
jgi:hypothetical protein